jgi:FkbM family methyltransferase
MTDAPKTVEPDPAIPRVSYAQNREDILLDRLFGDHVGRYMDVGACHPLLDSNTRFFYDRGWRGVNIEPSFTSFQRFLDQRPLDLNLNLAASDFDGELTFYEVDDHVINGTSTLSAEIAHGYRQRGFAVVEQQVPVRTIRSVIATHGIEPPDLVSIDVESHEASVIRGMPLESWRPRVLVVEATLPRTTTPSYQGWEPILLAHGYLLAAFNGVNRFFVRDDLQDSIELLKTPVSAFDRFVPYEVVAQCERAADLERRLATEENRTAVERRQHEQLRHEREALLHEREELVRAWVRDQSAWSDERRATERERAEWQARLAARQERSAEWQARAAEWQTRAAEAQARSIAFEVERLEWARLRTAIEEHNDRLRAQLEGTQRQLRPYRLLDRFGMVTASYGWARKLKHRLVS